MKERILMGFIGFVVILILSWAVVAVASSFNTTAPIRTQVRTTMKKVEASTDQGKVKSTRPANTPQGPKKATTNR